MNCARRECGHTEGLHDDVQLEDATVDMRLETNPGKRIDPSLPSSDDGDDDGNPGAI